jgi:hypothetical protein
MTQKEKQELYIECAKDNLSEALHNIETIEQLKEFVKSVNEAFDKAQDREYLEALFKDEEE